MWAIARECGKIQRVTKLLPMYELRDFDRRRKNAKAKEMRKIPLWNDNDSRMAYGLKKINCPLRNLAARNPPDTQVASALNRQAQFCFAAPRVTAVL
jgi:hypothetical protein